MSLIIKPILRGALFLLLAFIITACGAGKSVVEIEEQQLRENIDRQKALIEAAAGTYHGVFSNSTKEIGSGILEITLRRIPTSNPAIGEFTLSGSLIVYVGGEGEYLTVGRYSRGTYSSETGEIYLTNDSGSDLQGTLRQNYINVSVSTTQRSDMYFEGEKVEAQ